MSDEMFVVRQSEGSGSTLGQRAAQGSLCVAATWWQRSDLSVSSSWREKLWQGLQIPQGSQLKQVWLLMLSTCTSGLKHAVETAWSSSGDTLWALGQ